MWPDRVSNPGPLTYESGALPIALRGQAYTSQPASVSILLLPYQISLDLLIKMKFQAVFRISFELMIKCFSTFFLSNIMSSKQAGSITFDTKRLEQKLYICPDG